VTDSVPVRQKGIALAREHPERLQRPGVTYVWHAQDQILAQYEILQQRAGHVTLYQPLSETPHEVIAVVMIADHFVEA
jgi:hypothetical protein